MAENLTRKIIGAHLVSGVMRAGSEIEVRMDQTLTQDATGTMACLQFEALGVDRVRTKLSVSYVDHNTLQTGFRNPDDHRFLRTVAQRCGMVFSPPGTGICHQLHLENFAEPGATLLGADSHTPNAGGMGMFAVGAGGLSVALAMAGKAYALPMPKVVRVLLEGKLQGWASAKDVILHMLGLLTVKGGVGGVFEYCGPGVATLGVPERATIANMGAELGATSSVFPSDERTLGFLTAQGRADAWKRLEADPGAEYDEEIRVDLSSLIPLAAAPHMPDRVAPVAESAGLRVDQVIIGSCTNSSYPDLALAARILGGRPAAPHVDLMIAPGSRQVLRLLAREGLLDALLLSGARLLECACGPCIGMGGSPVSAGVSVRTFNRNFEGRSGTKDARVYLVGPAAAAFCALRGEFSDPSGWGDTPAEAEMPAMPSPHSCFRFPPEDGGGIDIVRGPNIVALEKFPPLEKQIDAPVLIRLGDNITTDHIMPAGPEITALRSNVPAIAGHVFERVDADFVRRARASARGVIVAGRNYGQGSSREHAALAPRHLGVRMVLALSLARIHRANLINFGILPLSFAREEDYERIAPGARVRLDTDALGPGAECALDVEGIGLIAARNDLSDKELRIIRAGGMLNYHTA
jgi:aconitate hydratase